MTRAGRLLALLAAALLASGLALVIGNADAGTGAVRATLGASQYVPTWKWDATTGVLPSGATFTRASAANCWNSSGTLVSLSTNVPCFEYDPATLVALGYRPEMQSTNGVLQSGDLGNAAWTATSLSRTSNSIAAPDGTTSAMKALEPAATSSHQVSQAVTLATNTAAGFSVFFKAGTGRTKFYVGMQASANNWATVVCDTSSVTVSQTGTGSSSGTISATQMRNVGNGWYRCGLTARVTGANPLFVAGLAPAATGNTFSSLGEISYAGDGSSFGYLWGAMADSAGAGITSYVGTTTATVTRAQDNLSLPVGSVTGWAAGSGGVLVAAYRLNTAVVVGGGAGQVPIAFTGTGANWIGMYALGGWIGGNVMVNYMRATSDQFIQTAGTPVAVFTLRKQAIGWSTTRAQMAHDGAFDLGTNGSYTVPPLTTLKIGIDPNSTGGLNGPLASAAYFPGARSDAFVTQVSK